MSGVCRPLYLEPVLTLRPSSFPLAFQDEEDDDDYVEEDDDDEVEEVGGGMYVLVGGDVVWGRGHRLATALNVPHTGNDYWVICTCFSVFRMYVSLL